MSNTHIYPLDNLPTEIAYSGEDLTNGEYTKSNNNVDCL
jgi:hypothetical protein